MDGAARLAKMFKERDNIPYMGPQIGVVISPPPEIKIGLGDKIILSKDHLIIAAHVLAGYQRDIEIPVTSDLTGNTANALVGTSTEHNHAYENLGIAGQMLYMDTLKAGDEVILVPSTDAQIYFLVDKAVRP